MSFGGAIRATSCSEVPRDGEALGRSRAQSAEPQVLRSDSELAISAWGGVQDVDSLRHRRARPCASVWENAFGAASGTVGPEASLFGSRWRGLPERLLRRPAATPRDGDFGCSRSSSQLNSSCLEAIDIDSCRRRRHSEGPVAPKDDGDWHGRAFFDNIWRADRYAELISRKSKPKPPQELLTVDERRNLAWDFEEAAKDGTESPPTDDASTTASEDDACSKIRLALKEAQHTPPSLRVRRMLETILPRHGAPNIPLEVVRRLEILAELEESQVKPRSRHRSPKRRPSTASAQSMQSTPGTGGTWAGSTAPSTPGTPPEVIADAAAAAGVRQGSHLKVPWPTLLSHPLFAAGAESIDCFSKGEADFSAITIGFGRMVKVLPPASPRLASLASPRLAAPEPSPKEPLPSPRVLAKARAAKQLRTGFNNLVGRGGGWKVETSLTQI